MAVGGAVFGGRFHAPLHSSRARAAPPLSRIGLELYAVRRAMRADPERTLAAIRDIGYTDVELLWSFGNFGRTTEQVHDALRATGLRAPSAHIAPRTIERDWERSLETARLLGHEYLIVPSLPAETKDSLDAWRSWADRFNRAGATARSAGVWLAFHNEPDHMKPIDGTVPYDVFVERLDPTVVRLQLDVGNMLMGGGDPFAYFDRYRDRYGSFHLKDVARDRSHDTEIGAGTFDFRRFLRAVPRLAEKPCFVEQEGATDELASARASWRWLHGLDL
jgi:sugar phosphate isomerase/epimerase